MNKLDALQQIGLSEKEAQVYVALLGLETAVVTDIAHASRLKRPTVYVILEELRKKGLILKVPHPKKSLYTAQDPDTYFNNSLDRVKHAYAALSELKAIQKKENKISIKYFEGEQGIEDALFYRKEELAHSEIVGFFAKGVTLTPRLFEISHKWRSAMKQAGVTVRAIAPRHESLEEFRATDTVVQQLFKQVPLESYSSDVSIHATDLFVCIIMFGAQQAIVIENKAVVMTVKQIFEMTWKNLK